ncbi:MAG: hypothetical protein ROW48_06260 [Bellilinea sp.]|jgi:hypothetical protein
MNVDEYYEEDEAPRQPPVYLLTGLVIGLLLGLLISLVIVPAQVVDTAPALLSGTDKDVYRLMIARAYQANGDLPRARERLKLLEDADPVQALAEHALRLQAASGSEGEIRALAELAAALTNPPQNANPPANAPTALPEEALPPVPTPQTFATLELAQAVQTATLPPTPTNPPPTPRPTFTPRVQPSPLPTLGAPFALLERREVCDAPQNPPRLQIEAQDSAGKPVPGIQISVAWDGGIDTFFTGLHPAISLGYADFDMQAGVVYSLRVGELSETINDLSAPPCAPEDGAAFTGSLYLVFRQP